MPPVGFEPAIPASERSHTHASDSVATGISEATNEAAQNKHKRRTSLPSVGFEPAITAIKMLQTCAIDRAASGVGWYYQLSAISYQRFI
jgi:hypothetical protein